MSLLENLIATTVATSGISEDDLLFVFSKGERKVYSAGEYLFQEGDPYLWAGIIEDGLVELARKQGDANTLISVLSKGATIAEAAFMGGVAHDVSAYTRKGATVWQVPIEALQTTFQIQTDVYYRTVAGYALEYRYAADKLRQAKEILRKDYERIIKEGWVSKDDLDYILKP
jgi:CRP-like cAMP-binding protein